LLFAMRASLPGPQGRRPDAVACPQPAKADAASAAHPLVDPAKLAQLGRATLAARWQLPSVPRRPAINGAWTRLRRSWHTGPAAIAGSLLRPDRYPRPQTNHTQETIAARAPFRPSGPCNGIVIAGKGWRMCAGVGEIGPAGGRSAGVRKGALARPKIASKNRRRRIARPTIICPFRPSGLYCSAMQADDHAGLGVYNALWHNTLLSPVEWLSQLRKRHVNNSGR
jgi:hypothetical protein